MSDAEVEKSAGSSSGSYSHQKQAKNVLDSDQIGFVGDNAGAVIDKLG